MGATRPDATNNHYFLTSPSTHPLTPPRPLLHPSLPPLYSQVEGVRFLWNACMGATRPDASRRRRRDETEHGAVLAHSMGLGKTFTVIAFLHTALRRAHNTAGVPYVQMSTGGGDGRPTAAAAAAGRQAAPTVSGQQSPPTALVLVPKSVASQWEQEMAKWLSDQTGSQGAQPLKYAAPPPSSASSSRPRPLPTHP